MYLQEADAPCFCKRRESDSMIIVNAIPDKK